MTLLGISADMNIALICSMTLAISVDDTIHFFHKFLDEKKRNTEVSKSVNNTLALVAKPLIGSSLIISITLLIFMLGDIRLFSQFSALLSLALLVALYYDLIVLPALIIKLKRFI
jgi:predicted RND superfamily exporter protein